MKKIALVGAFDRENYGDILFPIIVEEWFRKKQCNYSFDYYGLIESDLSKFGGRKTKSIEKLYKDKNDVIIIVGGQVLNARWSSMHLNLLDSSTLLKIYRIFYKIIGPQKSNQYAKLRLKGKTFFPWIISDKVSNGAEIFYNAVGGTGFSNYSNSEVGQLKHDLNSSSYISVRDKLTSKNLIEMGIENVKVSPDSAIIMSQLFDKKTLEKKISPRIKEMVSQYKANDIKYLCFQIGIFYSKYNESIIAKELIKSAEKFGMKVILLPIGRASGHEDHIALSNIKDQIDSNISVELIEERGIYDIMYIISQSSIFLGTSLHGCITALSYGIPCIALDNRVVKTEAFLKEFSIEEQLYSIPYDKIVESIEYSLNIPSQKIASNSEKIIDLANQNFESMYEILNK